MTVSRGDVAVMVGAANLFIPGPDGTIYLAPSTIVHYVDAHDYAPPEPFQRAVEVCPPMRSMDYLRAIRKLAALRPPR